MLHQNDLAKPDQPGVAYISASNVLPSGISFMAALEIDKTVGRARGVAAFSVEERGGREGERMMGSAWDLRRKPS